MYAEKRLKSLNNNKNGRYQKTNKQLSKVDAIINNNRRLNRRKPR